MKVGLHITCSVCGRIKKPRGRSAPVTLYPCDWECPGYLQDPQVGTLWPGETEAEFGYPVGPHGWKEETVEDSRNAR